MRQSEPRCCWWSQRNPPTPNCSFSFEVQVPNTPELGTLSCLGDKNLQFLQLSWDKKQPKALRLLCLRFLVFPSLIKALLPLLCKQPWAFYCSAEPEPCHKAWGGWGSISSYWFWKKRIVPFIFWVDLQPRRNGMPMTQPHSSARIPIR